MKKAFFSCLLLVVCLSLGACGKETSEAKNEGMVTSIHADYPVYDTAQELVESADLVFGGTVENITYETMDVRTESGVDSLTGLSESQGMPYTLYEIKVTEIYKGSVEGDTIIVKCLGGEVDGNIYVLDETSTISMGETYLFLTETYENSYPSLLNATQASYDMNAPESLNEENNDTITLSQILEVLGQ